MFSLIQLGTYYEKPDADQQAEQLAYQALTVQKQVDYAALNRVWHLLTDESVYYAQNLYTDLTSAYYLLADVHELRGNTDQALLNYFRVIKDIERSGLYEELAYPYAMIGRNYAIIGQTDKGISYYQKSLAVSRQKGEAAVVSGMIRWLAEALLQRGRAREALQVLEQYRGQNLSLSYGGKILSTITYAKCYSALGQYRQAEQQYLEAIAMCEKSPDFSPEHHVKYAASQFFVARGEYRKAEPLLKRVLTLVKGQFLEFEQVHLLQFKVDSALGNYSQAIKHYQLHTALKDSLLNEAKSKQIEELNIRYQTEKKEKDLKLKEQNIALLQQQSKTQQTQRNALLGGSVLLLSLLALSYNRYRLKQRGNQLLQVQQQELQVQQQQVSRKNEELQGLLAEKERLLAEQARLLKEIHHRVKNNLQVVMSLLSSQAHSLQDQAALSAIQESQHRVQAMALIHQKLYQAEGVSRIPMKAYLEELVAYLFDSYRLSYHIRMNLQVEELELDVVQAVPLGLIINEAITNAFKYAFPGGRAGSLHLSLQQLQQHTCQLVIADDGVGLPEGFDPSRRRSLGMTLLQGFARQLGGKLSISSPPGTTIRLIFQREPFPPDATREPSGVAVLK